MSDAPELIWVWHRQDSSLDARLWEPLTDAPSFFPGELYIRADLAIPAVTTDPLGAAAMREAAADAAKAVGAVYAETAKKPIIGAEAIALCNSGAHVAEAISERIRALPLPDHTARLAQALAMREIAALVEALRRLIDLSDQYLEWEDMTEQERRVSQDARHALAALGQRHD